MIRARMSNGDFLMGLTRENIDRLAHRDAIVIDLKPMGGTDLIYIVFGETMDDLMQELSELNGAPLPHPTPWPGEPTEH